MARTTKTLEIERKFRPHSIDFPPRHGSFDTPFTNIVFKSTTRFRDVYYDVKQHLDKAGIWVRERDGKWECKTARGESKDGERTARFEETTDYDEIRKIVKQALGSDAEVNCEKESFGLEVLADIDTVRRTWLVNGKFTVVVDVTQWGYMVGEVELTEEIIEDQEKMETLAHKMAMMEERLDNFMEKHLWAFPDRKVMSKLDACLEQQKES